MHNKQREGKDQTMLSHSIKHSQLHLAKGTLLQNISLCIYISTHMYLTICLIIVATILFNSLSSSSFHARN